MPFDHLPALCKHRSSGRYYVTLNDREVYLGTDRTIAKLSRDRVVAGWLAAGRRLPDRRDGHGLTIAQLLLAYKRFAEGHYVRDGEPTKELGHVQSMSRLLRTYYGEQPAATFGPLALTALQSRMIELGWSRGYCNGMKAKIVRLFKWAASRELLPVTVYQALETVRGLAKGRSKARETEPVRPVDDATIEQTIACLPPVVADMVRLQRLTGMRPAELCQLRPRDVDRSGDVWSYRPPRHKSEHRGKDRVVFIGPKAQAVLAPYLRRASDSACFTPAEAEAQRRAEAHGKRRTPACCGNVPGSNRKARPTKQPGDRYDVAAYRRAIAYACERAFAMPSELRRGPKDETKADKQRREAAAREWRARHVWAPNQLRHSTATEIRKRFGLEAAQVVLGHTTANVTQVYAERDHAAAAEAMRAVG